MVQGYYLTNLAAFTGLKIIRWWAIEKPLKSHKQVKRNKGNNRNDYLIYTVICTVMQFSIIMQMKCRVCM